MKRLKKLIIATCSCLCLLSVTAFASTVGFDTSVPSDCGTKELPSVTKGDNDIKHFRVSLTNLGGTASSVRVWTEGSWGGNYSSPSEQIERGQSRNIPYYTNDVPKPNVLVKLNLENTQYVDQFVWVKGSWTPN